MPHEVRILALKHMACQNPGIFRDYARTRNVQFEEIDLHRGDSIPNIRNFDALWVMGGTMNVWEEQEFPWLKLEKQAIRKAFDSAIPFFGICLGHQLLADALGGTVVPSQHVEIGSVPIEPTQDEAGHPLLSGLDRNTRWANVHTAEISVPPQDAKILAKSSVCANHAMAVGEHGYSVQFHPEVCQSTLSGWLSIPGIAPKIVELLGQQGFETFKTEIEANRRQTEKAAARLFDNWLSLVFTAKFA